jgi:hypothetical protein
LIVLILCVLIAVVRVLAFDATTPQGADEPGHIAPGLELLQFHTYLLDPLHPPLAREAMALPLFLTGHRIPPSAEGEVRPGNYTEVGNAVLYAGGHYMRNLLLARVGMIPFLCLAIVCVFFWTDRLFGTVAACIAAFLLSTLPSVLAFSGLAYNDAPAMCTQFACLFTFALWVEEPTSWRSVLLGIAGGLAIATKFTSFIFLPAAGLAVLMLRFSFSSTGFQNQLAKSVLRLAGASVLAFVILWASYGFSVGHLRQSFEVSPAAIRYLDASPQATLPTFQHFPGPLRNAALSLLRADPMIPAPDLIRGVEEARLLKSSAPSCYLYGHEKNGGWWFFFPVALALKTPIPFLILALVGFVHTSLTRRREWGAWMPAIAVAAVLFITMFISYKVGIRHVLVVLPLLAMLAGAGAAFLWRSSNSMRSWGRFVLGILLIWQTVSTARAQSDLLAYFNELAPRDSSLALVKGCDLDCGQDVVKLGKELQARKVDHVTLAMWGTADVAELGFPTVKVLQPNDPVSGWVAISVRTLRTGQVVVIDQSVQYTYFIPHGALAWADTYQPVAHIGQTILLYYIPSPQRPG